MKTLAICIVAALLVSAAQAREKRPVVPVHEKGFSISLAFDDELARGRDAMLAEIDTFDDDDEHSAFFDKDDSFIAATDGTKPLRSEWSWAISTAQVHKGGNLVQLITYQGDARRMGHWRCVSKDGGAYRVCASFDRPGVTMLQKAATAWTWDMVAFSETPGPIMKQFQKLSGEK